VREATTAVLAAILAILLPRAAFADDAAALGDAYRAFESGEFREAHDLAMSIDLKSVNNDDYVLYIAAQSAFMLADFDASLALFKKLGKHKGSRFAIHVPWRLADCQWERGNYQTARKAYHRLVEAAKNETKPWGDMGTARFRIAKAYSIANKKTQAKKKLKRYLLKHPAHPLADEAEDLLREIGGDDAVEYTPSDRIERAQRLKDAHLWHEAIAELALIGEDVSDDVKLRRDYWTGMTLFKMRRRYKDAGDILLGLYKKMGPNSARALFTGARALSRADFDEEAIEWYQRVVAEFPSTMWAKEAQYLSGWLHYNLGQYDKAVPHLEKMLDRYGDSKWAAHAEWFLAMSHYFAGHYKKALPGFEALGRRGGKLTGGKGRYWTGRTQQKLGRTDDANSTYEALVGRYPLSWYALLARARLAEQGIDIPPFGRDPRSSNASTAIDSTVDESLATDKLIRRADELIAAGLDVEAGYELRRKEKAFLKRHKRSAAYAMLLDRYAKASNFNRPWMMGVVYGGSKALDAPPEGRSKIWWQYAYPMAYADLIEEHRHIGGAPVYYLQSIMRKESGFDPHVLSYADAIGLLQMIPPTTKRVVAELGIDYTTDLLYDPVLNIKTGSWYIGRLLSKFKGQIPFGAGSFNSGPRPVMKWLDKNGERPVDEFVELVSYRQTREYMKKVTETYARYMYLYEGAVYVQPLAVDKDYVDDDLTY
jgi:soluble lytic murein transglycosylase